MTKLKMPLLLPSSSPHVYVHRWTLPYKHDEPFYVGKGKDRGQRAISHLKIKHGDGNPLLFAIIEEHRVNGLTPRIEIAATFATETEALIHEITLIDQYGRINLGTGTLANLTGGGEGCNGLNLTPEQLQKYLAASNARWTIPELRQAYLANLEKIRSDPEWREARSGTMSQLNDDPEFQTKRRKRYFECYDDPEFWETRNAKISATASRRSRNANGRFIKGTEATSTEPLPLSPEHRQKLSHALTAFWHQKHTSHS